MKNLRLFALLLLLLSLSACADGSGVATIDPPDTSNPEMTWEEGEWDQKDWSS